MNLRPLGIGELIDATIRLYRHNLRALVMITAAIHLPIAVIRVAFSNPTPAPLPGPSPFAGALTPGDLLAGLLEFVVGFPIGIAAVTAFVAHRWLGRTATPESALRGAVRRIGPILLGTLALGLVIGTVTVAILIALIVPVVGTASLANLAEGGPALLAAAGFIVLAVLAAFIVMWILVIRLGFWAQIIVLEQAGPIASLRRSWALTKGIFWRTAGAWTVLTLLYYVLMGIVVAILGIFVGIALIRGAASADPAVTAFTALFQAVGNIVLQPFLLTGFTLLYIDLRVRKEAFDLQIMAEELREPSSGLESPTP